MLKRLRRTTPEADGDRAEQEFEEQRVLRLARQVSQQFTEVPVSGVQNTEHPGWLRRDHADSRALRARPAGKTDVSSHVFGDISWNGAGLGGGDQIC